MILPVKKIVEEFYCDTSRLKKNYSIATVNCSHLDKYWITGAHIKYWRHCNGNKMCSTSTSYNTSERCASTYRTYSMSSEQ